MMSDMKFQLYWGLYSTIFESFPLCKRVALNNSTWEKCKRRIHCGIQGMSIRPSYALHFTSLYTALYRNEIFYPLIKAKISDNDPNLSEDARKFPNAAEVNFWRSLGDKNNRKSKVRNWVLYVHSFLQFWLLSPSGGEEEFLPTRPGLWQNW